MLNDCDTGNHQYRNSLLPLRKRDSSGGWLGNVGIRSVVLGCVAW